MLKRFIQRNYYRLAYTHSFYSPQTLEFPINSSEEGYLKNKQMMGQVNTQFTNILKQVH